MTNPMNALIEEPKMDQKKADLCSHIKIIGENDNRKNKYNLLLKCSLCLLMTVTFIFQLFIISKTFNYSKDETLVDSWIRTADSQLAIHEAQKYTPEQLHLSLGIDCSELYLTWSTMSNVSTLLQYQEVEPSGSLGEEKFAIPSESRVVVGDSDPNWIHATKQQSRTLFIYRGKLEKLRPGRAYIYRVKAMTPSATYFSRTYQYIATNISDPNSVVHLALFGDLGLENAQSVPRLIDDVDSNMYDAIIHNGDFGYDLNDRHGRVGDEFMRLIEPIAARLPYQTSVGNHEAFENFTHYRERFTMINGGMVNPGSQNNFYYSFNLGPIHFISFSTEFYYFLEKSGLQALQDQYEWLYEDLLHASSPEQRALRPWIVVFGHRPMYCSSRDRDDCTKENNILRKGVPRHGYGLEKLFFQFGVDVEFWSHEHQYERFLPVYDGQIFNGTDSLDDPYNNPLAPVHFISGSAGCKERLDPFQDRAAIGSVKQISDYGYTRLEAKRCQLLFQQVSDDQEGVVLDEIVITKTRQNFPIKSSIDLSC